MSKVRISFATDTQTKNEAEAITSKLGISLSASLNAYLRQICFQHKIPFQLALPSHVRTDNTKDIQRRTDKFANGDLGKKHHLID